MSRGGRRSGSGRKGLTDEQKLECAALLRELVDAHLPIRESRTFARLTRGRTDAGDGEPFYDELQRLFADIALPDPEDLARLDTKAARKMLADSLKDRQEYLSNYRRNPGSSAINAFFAGTKLPRYLVPTGPTASEMGAFHEHIALVLSARLGRRISRRQVAEACRWVRDLERRLRAEDDRSREDRLDNVMSEDEEVALLGRKRPRQSKNHEK